MSCDMHFLIGKGYIDKIVTSAMYNPRAGKVHAKPFFNSYFRSLLALDRFWNHLEGC